MTDYKLELRARVEALEAAQRPRVFTAEEVAPAVVPTVKESLTVDGSLVERVADAIAAEATSAGIVNFQIGPVTRTLARFLMRAPTSGF